MGGRHTGADSDGESWEGLPHPDDRLWRHPSELSQLLPTVVRRRPGRTAFGVLAGACVGAGLAAAAMILIGPGGPEGVGDSVNTAGRSPSGTGTVTVPARLGPVGPEQDAASDAGVGPALYSPLSRLAASIVAVDVEGPAAGGGCGFSLDGGNTVVTTAGLVSGAAAVFVTPAGGVRSDAVVLGADDVTGVAVLRMTSGAIPALGATDGTVGTGDVVTSYAPRANPPMAVGEVTGIGVDGTAAGGRTILDTVATDLPVGTGCMGAPVFDSRGDAVGMVVSAGGGGPTLVVPMTRTRDVARQLAESGVVEHGWLGVSQIVATSAGVSVLDVVPGSPAAAAGITPGSVIVAVDGHGVRTVPDLWNQVTMRQPGDAVDIEVETGSRTTLVHVVLGRAVPAPVGATATQS